MGRADFLRLGDWNATCYFCGRKRKASEMKRYWKGFWVCPEEWEPRQPQDFVRGIPDIQTPPWVQDQSDSFVEICTPNSSSAIPSLATPGCMIPSMKLPPPAELEVFVCTAISALSTSDFGTADCMVLAF